MCKRRQNQTDYNFFYHLVEPTADGIQWNEDYISCVISPTLYGR